MELCAGDILDGKYRIVRLLGEGGMGAVYEGENTRIHRRVAIKVLHASVAAKDNTVRRFEQEAKAAGLIGSEHIVEVLDIGSLPSGERFMVMEFLDGESLSARIEKHKRLTPHDAAPIVHQLLEGLAAAHRAGIIHRDLKPDNVFLVRSLAGRRDFVKVLDFGVSKFSVLEGDGMSMTSTGAVMGTPFYLSPEQARGIKELDARSDLYSVGVVLYQAVTGRLPFHAETFNELVFKIALESPEPAESVVPDLDRAFAVIIAKAMVRDPSGRFQSAREFQQALEAWESLSPPADSTSGFRRRAASSGPVASLSGTVALPPESAPAWPSAPPPSAPQSGPYAPSSARPAAPPGVPLAASYPGAPSPPAHLGTSYPGAPAAPAHLGASYPGAPSPPAHLAASYPGAPSPAHLAASHPGASPAAHSAASYPGASPPAHSAASYPGASAPSAHSAASYPGAPAPSAHSAASYPGASAPSAHSAASYSSALAPPAHLAASHPGGPASSAHSAASYSSAPAGAPSQSGAAPVVPHLAASHPASLPTPAASKKGGLLIALVVGALAIAGGAFGIYKATAGSDAQSGPVPSSSQLSAPAQTESPSAPAKPDATESPTAASAPTATPTDPAVPPSGTLGASPAGTWPQKSIPVPTAPTGRKDSPPVTTSTPPPKPTGRVIGSEL